ncbi:MULTISPECIES: hypothetical protein [unclassified Psychrobacter]|uniref:hypothetical protein n=1 Tax=unclassified Psychrobacter TaxID=196806 RepID=UPI0025B57AAC|nr:MULTISPECIES: hypothetical protein [unclassified Psychrobacter]MDN3454364.1 hypothetical protein [Psychrobacter sp. APC 3350]MDN3503609.1 hypothetical protein [Psychrobacter sp. 5A.1]
MPTIEQKIARKQDELNRLKTKQRKLETGQKVIIGGMMLSLAKEDPQIAEQLLKWIEGNITRKTDLDRLEDVTTELRSDFERGFNHGL